MCVFFISLPLYAQPSELFLKGQPLNIQSVVEFMVSSEWFKLHVSALYVAILRLLFNLQSNYTRCVACFLGVLEVGWAERDLVSILGTMT